MIRVETTEVRAGNLRGAAGARAFAMLCLLGGAATCLGCRSSNLSSEGAEVASSPNAPVDQGFASGICTRIGAVVGRGSLGATATEETLLMLATNDLRNHAAWIGANVVKAEPVQFRKTGSIDSLFNSTAIVHGTAYKCPLASGADGGGAALLAASPEGGLDVTAASAAHTQERDRRNSSPPDGAGGFFFGTSAAAAEEACTRQNLPYQREGDHARCGGSLVSLGAPATVRLQFCADAVCGIDLVLIPDARERAAKQSDVIATLQTKYGAPDAARSATSNCDQDAACVADAAAAPSTTWTWVEGYRVEEQLTAVGIELGYANPARARQIGAGGPKPGPAF